MFTIIWNPRSFHVVEKLQKDTKMTSEYFVTHILGTLEQAVFSREGHGIRNGL
jgi:hypothetical protein